MKIDLLHIVDGRMGGEQVAALGVHRCARNESIKSCLISFHPSRGKYAINVSKGEKGCIKIQLSHSRLFSIVAIYCILKRLLKKSLIAHIHGIWPIHSIVSLVICSRFKKNYLISPHGSLERWSLNHKRLKKKIGLLAIINLLKGANSFFVTSIEESKSVAKIIRHSNNIIMHSLGLDLENISRKLDSYQNKNILFVSRLSPKKGVDILIKAFINIGKNDWQLTIIGPSEKSYLRSLQELIPCQDYSSRIKFLGPRQKSEIYELYKTASFFALATHSENFGFVIAEALGSKLPVLTTIEAPWKEINEYSCGHCIEDTQSVFEKYMEKMMNYSPEELKIMGENGYKLISERYSWHYASRNLINRYRELLIKL